MALNLNDATSNGNTLTNVNSVADSNSTPFGGKNTDSALFTAASTQALNTASSPTNLNLGSSFTLECWLKTTTISVGSDVLFSKWAGAGHRSYMLQVNRNTGGKFSLLSSYDGTNAGSSANDNNTAITINTYNHVAITYDNTTYRWYLNGVADGTTIATNGSLFSSDALLAIGGNGGGTEAYFDGNIDEVRIWNVTRSASQISNNYNKQLQGNESGLVGYWPFNSPGFPTGFFAAAR